MMKKTYFNFHKGYTLIELLVVMGIVTVLMGIALVAFQGTRSSARDSRRKADIEQIRSALEMYRSDAGSYPVGNSLGTSITYGSNTYLQVVPVDPVSGLAYSYTGNASAYTICSVLETGAETPLCTGAGDCPVGYGYNYKACNP